MLLKLLTVFFILIVLFFITHIIKNFAKKETQEDDLPCPPQWYRKAQGLFTPAEQHFLISLEIAIKDLSVKLYGKPRIADIIKVESGLNKSDYASAFRKICSKHVDFILLDPKTSAPLLAIELDDRSHEKRDRRLRDAFVDEVMYQANLPILHVKAAHNYDTQMLRSQIIGLIKQSQQ